MQMKTERNVLKLGNSNAVTLPKPWVKSFDLKPRDKLEIIYGDIIIIKTKNLQIDVDTFLKEVETALRPKGVTI